MNLLIATANKHKANEISSLLPGTFNVFTFQDIGFTLDVPETMPTIRQNAIQKAEFVKHWLLSNLSSVHVNLVVADDSGLEVNCLNGAPGVYSARYAGVDKNDLANNNLLLANMKNCTDRKARFVCCIALVHMHKNKIDVFEGEVKGTIAYEPRGKNGFGYDPLFIPTGYRSTFAEMDAVQKNQLSHRGNAVKKLIDFLNN